MTTEPAIERPECAPPSAKKDGTALAWVLLAAALAAVVFIRLRLASLPLERDEGEYAYMGQLMLGGVPPYQAAYNMKWPGTYAGYAAIMAVFGQSAAAIRVGLVLVNLATAFFVYQIARRCTDVAGGCLAAAAYALLSISPAVLGLAAHATHFVLLPALAAVWLVQAPDDHRRFGRLLLAGAAAGTAAVMKQSGAAFFGFLVFWISLCAWREKAGPRAAARRLAGVTAGFAAPVGLMFLLVAVAGDFDRFWFWTWDYARAYAALMPPLKGAHALGEYFARIFAAAPILCLLGVIGLAALWLPGRTARPRALVVGFSAFSFLAVCPGFYFSGQYMIQLNPAIALLIAIGVQAGRQRALVSPRLSRLAGIFSLFAALGLAQTLFIKRDVFFRQAPPAAARTIYGFNPFPEAEVIGRHLAAHSPAGATVAVVGSEPEIYFYARRRAVTGYLYVYPMTERQPYAQAMQRDFTAEIERGAPDYVVFVNSISSWFSYSRTDSHYPLLTWFQDYERQHLSLVGFADMTGGETTYRWSFAEERISPPTAAWIAVYRRMRPGEGNPTAAAGSAGGARPARTTIAW